MSPADSSPVAEPAPVLPAEEPHTETLPPEPEADGPVVSTPETQTTVADEAAPPLRTRRRRQPKLDPAELKLQGRNAICPRMDIAAKLGKQVKLRILSAVQDSTWELGSKTDDELAALILKESKRLADPKRVLAAATAIEHGDPLGDLKGVIFEILLQEEAYSSPEQQLYEKVIAFEKDLVKRSRALGLDALKKTDPERWHALDTYRIVLAAAWSNDGSISTDEARLLAVLRGHLNITREEHWLLSAVLKRFPKDKCELHSGDDVHNARKELHKQGLLWTYKDEEQSVDAIPVEIAETLRRNYAGQELQSVNYERLVSHDIILAGDLRGVLAAAGLDKSGNKPELIERVVFSNIKPSAVLDALDKERLAAICGSAELKVSGSKADLIARVIAFYDDLTFKEIITRDEREEWYASYDFFACRAHAELRAKKLITRDLDIEHRFEDATAFLFEKRLGVPCDMSRKENKADGRLQLDNNQCILLDCKSAEQSVNLQDYLDGQFDGYLRKERDGGRNPIGFLVIGPAFTPQSIPLALKYKAMTGWDVALLTADGLKYLAERWALAQPGKPFPVRFLCHAGLIDRDRADVILSMV